MLDVHGRVVSENFHSRGRDTLQTPPKHRICIPVMHLNLSLHFISTSLHFQVFESKFSSLTLYEQSRSHGFITQVNSKNCFQSNTKLHKPEILAEKKTLKII